MSADWSELCSLFITPLPTFFTGSFLFSFHVVLVTVKHVTKFHHQTQKWAQNQKCPFTFYFLGVDSWMATWRDISVFRAESFKDSLQREIAEGILVLKFQAWFSNSSLHQNHLRACYNTTEGPHSKIYGLISLMWGWEFPILTCSKVILMLLV